MNQFEKENPNIKKKREDYIQLEKSREKGREGGSRETTRDSLPKKREKGTKWITKRARILIVLFMR